MNRFVTATLLMATLSGVACASKEKRSETEKPASTQTTDRTAPQFNDAVDSPMSAMALPSVERATATVRPAPSNKAKGRVDFLQTPNGVRVIATFEGLKPNSEHGFHVHEFGDCSDPKFTTAGGHFNPMGAPHGSPTAPEKHAGDFGNVKTDGKGRASIERTIEGIKLNDPQITYVGRAIVLHMKRDDLKTQPSGDSGDRIACGTIGVAKQ